MFRPPKAATKVEEQAKTEEQIKEEIEQQPIIIIRGGGGPRLTSPEAVQSGNWVIANLLNPHPVSLSTLLNPHPVTQVTRTLFLTKPEREDLISLGGVVSPNNAGVQIQAGSGSLKIKVYDAGYHAAVAGLHYFYFGTSTASTTKRLCTLNDKLAIHKTFVQPRVGAAGDGLYLFSSVSETNMPYDVGYVQE
jgi:hypothetical protein